MGKLHALGLVAIIAVGGVSGARADERCGGVELPAQVQDFGSVLTRNGVGLREATVLNVDVYVGALYLQHRSRSPEAVLDPREPKVVVLRFVRNVDRDEMIQAMNEALEHNVSGEQLTLVRGHMQAFVRRLPALHVGTELVLSYRPGRGIELRVDGKSLGVDRDDAFGNLVFRAWLGPHPPDADLKAGMLGGPCS
jgi:hypothetical protein